MRNRSYELMYGQKFGIAVFFRMYDRAVVGFPRAYNSDDPVGVTEVPAGLSRCARTGGLGYVEDDKRGWVFGRESLRQLFVDRSCQHLDCAAAERAFLSDWCLSRTAARQEALDTAYRTMVPRERIAHEIANQIPGIRVWSRDRTTGAVVKVGKIRLKAEYKNFLLGGIFMVD